MGERAMKRAWILGACVAPAFLNGCFPQQTSRSQVAEDVSELDKITTIGRKTIIGNVEAIPVSGVGLVYNLRGTGSQPVPDQYRTMLEQSIRRKKGNPKEFLDDPKKEHSLVLVSAVIPPGARIGDKLEAAVQLPPGSRTSSVKYGILFQTELHNHELAASTRDAMSANGIPLGKSPVASEGTLLMGNRLAIAEGPLVAGHEANASKDPDGGIDQPKAARIWDGVKCQTDRPYYFLLDDVNAQPRLAMVIAERLNAVFPAPGEKVTKLADAKVSGKPLVVCFVPPTYRLNHTRFLMVARQVPLTPIASDSTYRKQLENDLLRSETAVTAAIKLEALGIDSRQALRVGLQSDSPWVRFASAESLAYLGHADGAKDLGELAEKHPSFRPQCLTALASLDDAVCLDQLAELMKKPDAALRYGAFTALRNADEKHEAVRGKHLNASYHLHLVAPETDPMVHINTERRAEITMFGSRFPMRTPFSFPLGKDFTVSAKEGEPTVTITRLVTDKNGEPGTVVKQTRTDLAEIIVGLGDLGGTYAEAVEFLRRTQKAEVTTTAIHINNAPHGLTIPQLAMIAVTDPTVEKADLETRRIGRSDVVQASYDLPNDADRVKALQVPEPTLAPRTGPGRLFKRDQ